MGVIISALGLGTALASLSGPWMVIGAIFAAAAALKPIYKGLTAVPKSYFPLASQKKINR